MLAGLILFGRRQFIVAGLLLAGAALAAGLEGPRSGRVLVVANANSPASLELAWEYLRQRSLPPANLLRIPFDHPINLDPKAYHERLGEPIARRLTELNSPVDYLVLTRDVPYRVGRVSVAAALLFGGPQNLRPHHPYFMRDAPFDASLRYGGASLHLPTLVTGYTFADALALIRRADVHYPSPAGAGTFYLCEGKGPRGSRAPQIDEGLKLLRQIGARGERVAGANLDGRLDILGQFTGDTRLNLAGNRYLPGAIVDNMTSFGGYLLEGNAQMSILSFIQQGASGAYGTVSEPTNAWARWANFSLPARYAAGFNLAEVYYQTVQDFTFGVVVGDPLTAPFARPPAIELFATATGPLPPGQPAEFALVAREGSPGDGVSTIIVWLDDLWPVHAWQPTVPVGATCTLRVGVGEKLLAGAEVKVVDQPEPLANLLAAVSQNIGQIGQIGRAGRHGDKLLMMMMPIADDQGRPLPVTCEFRLDIDGQETTVAALATAQPLIAHGALLDFGNQPPRPGDRITVTVGRLTRSAQAFATDTMETLLERLIRVMVNMPPLGEDGPFNLQVRQIPTEPPRFELLIVPRAIGARQSFPLSVDIRRAADSTFAAGLEKQPNYWRDLAVGGLAEAILAPRLPAPEVAQRFAIPAELLTPGPHRLLATAFNAAGHETIAVLDFEVAGPDGTPAADTYSMRLSGSTFDLGEEMMVFMKHPIAVATLHPKLVVDGLVVCAWAPGTLVGALPLNLPLICPGRHEVWLEWHEDPRLPRPTEKRRPAASSARHAIFVRRPLAAGLTLAPATVQAGQAKTVRLSGPYLSDRIRVVAGQQPVFLTRNPDQPLFWDLDISRLPPGRYPLNLVGDAETDQSDTLPTPLTITPPGN